ncbi:MAG: alpha/beta hydrolase fold domain-containing protein, partial [Pseudomonadota bacterium]
MSGCQITDWDDAYSNAAHIQDSQRWPDEWVELAARYRADARCELDIAYGEHGRQVYDLFLPQGEPAGLLVFIHGGYWLDFDKSYWSHLAQGGVDSGWAVAVPSYVLCPEAGIGDIMQMVGAAIRHAADKIHGPIVLTGHSAGGHLAACMVCDASPLPFDVRQRVVHTVAISGLHDLRPLLKTQMNDRLKLTGAEATRLSPALRLPDPRCRLTAWVGRAERPEFLRQSELIANVWRGLGAWTQCIVAPEQHHFDVIDGLCDAHSPLIKTALAHLPLAQVLRHLLVQHSLIEACQFSEAKDARLPGFGKQLYEFISPLFRDAGPAETRVIKAACLLHDVSWRAHPDYRHEVCFDNVTRANLGGLTHPERVFIGVALLHRYKNNRA